MTQLAAQRLLIALVLAALVSVTALFIVGSMRNRQRDGGPPLQGGSYGSQQNSALDQRRPLKDFVLTDRFGQPFDSRSIKGKVKVYCFFFTRCPTVCPQVLAQTAELQKKLKATPQWDDVRLVSITVDPEYDTPAVLDERASLWEADATHWLFLTGSKEEIWSLTSSRDGFQLAVGDAKPGEKMSIAHSSRYVLVDQQQQIVGYYDALDEAKRQELMRDLMRLLQE